MNGWKVINADDPKNEEIITSILKLRYKIFVRDLKWTVGLTINHVAQTEQDEYDKLPGTYYIVHIDDNGQVAATCRLRSTIDCYMLKDKYSNFVNKRPLPQQHDVWEITRFCASDEIKQSGINITGYLFAAVIEFSLQNGIKEIVSLSTVGIDRVIALNHWKFSKLGDLMEIPIDECKCYALALYINKETLIKIREACLIKEYLVTDV